jgi:N utilization substance protein B
MKTPLDPRHKKREKTIQDLFVLTFRSAKPKTDLGREVNKALVKIDSIISKAAPEWPLTQINKVDLTILRLAIWELVIKATQPPKVIIDEAIELAKAFGSENSPSFVNGVLGTVYKNLKKTKKENGA